MSWWKKLLGITGSDEQTSAPASGEKSRTITRKQAKTINQNSDLAMRRLAGDEESKPRVRGRMLHGASYLYDESRQMWVHTPSWLLVDYSITWDKGYEPESARDKYRYEDDPAYHTGVDMGSGQDRSVTSYYDREYGTYGADSGSSGDSYGADSGSSGSDSGSSFGGDSGSSSVGGE